MTSENSKEQKILALYDLINSEIERYRDYEWKITTWAVTLLGGTIASTNILHFDKPEPVQKPYIHVLLIIFTFVVTVYSCWHIHSIHKNLTWNRNIRERLTKLLGYYEKGVFCEESLLPESLKVREISYFMGLPHLYSWWGLIIATGIFTTYFILFHF